MPLILGPILGFQGINNSLSTPKWLIGVLAVTADENIPSLFLIHNNQEIRPVILKELGGKRVARYDLAINLESNAKNVDYQIDDNIYRFNVPAKKSAPRIAYTSCNGFSSLKLMKQVEEKFANWRRMGELHDKQPYQLLVMGGDQVYADSLWETIPALKNWNKLSNSNSLATSFTSQLEHELENFYFRLYCDHWNEPTSAKLFCSIPTVMMWDDHDIFDGWGSYSAARQQSPVFQGIFKIAKQYFHLFQHQGLPSKHYLSINQGFTVAHQIGEFGFLVLDLRSARTREQVISSDHWEEIYNWLDKNSSHLTHLFLFSSIPVLHPSFNMLEQALGVFPGQPEMEDDLRDHWTSRGHTGERLRLIHRLFELAAKNIRVTIISGDVHIAAVGAIESSRHGELPNPPVINQLTASGVVHPPPPGIVLLALNHLFNEEEEIDRGIIGRMLKFPGTPYRFIGKRNWLSLEPDLTKSHFRIWANWYVEGEDRPYTKVIHGV